MVGQVKLNPGDSQICGNPDGMAAGEIGRLVVREGVFEEGHHLAGTTWAGFEVRRVFDPGQGLRDLGPARVYIHGDCTMAELLVDTVNSLPVIKATAYYASPELADRRAKRQVFEWCHRLCTDFIVSWPEGASTRMVPKQCAANCRAALERDGWEVAEHPSRGGNAILLTACRPIGGKAGA